MSDKIIIRRVVDITDPEYFCNKSWTVSYNVNTKSWISFHTYIPNFYIAENNFFYSGLNSCCDDDISLDVISTIILPPVTTTTTSTSSSSTTSTTTRKPYDCFMEGTYEIYDCSMEGIVTNGTESCICYTLSNSTELPLQYSYTPCSYSEPLIDTLLPDGIVGICAKKGSVTGADGIVISEGNVCLTDGDCIIVSTTSSTTTVCTNCKTYYITNSTTSPVVLSDLIDCTLGLLYSYTVSNNGKAYVCSCVVPTVPAGVTSVEVGTGCNKCFCYTLQNLQDEEILVPYLNCAGESVQYLLLPGSIGSICVYNGVVSPIAGVVITPSTSPCTSNDDC